MEDPNGRGLVPIMIGVEGIDSASGQFILTAMLQKIDLCLFLTFFSSNDNNNYPVR